MINLIISLTKSLSYTIIWMLFVIPSCVSSVEKPHVKCADPFPCGNQQEGSKLYYPFWKPGREECGHPDFEVNCSGDYAEFNISSVRFRILEMNFHIIKLVRIDYLNNLCSQYPVNTTIIQEVLPLHPDTKLLTFYYNCSGSRADVPSKDYCENDTGGKSYLTPSFNSGDREILDELNASCKKNFNIPVSLDALRITEGNQSLKAMQVALDEGFTLELNRECSQCYRSKGACGYSSGKFICYCRDDPHTHTCEKKGNDIF